ncbi:MAG TPA: nucleotidyltransferase domain-containing protein, partial [Candidatus Kapabacteria bacterium]
MSAFGLSSREREMICDVLDRHREVNEVRIFGSRAKGNFRPNSDIDLALSGNISLHTLTAIAGELDELPLPY